MAEGVVCARQGMWVVSRRANKLSAVAPVVAAAAVSAPAVVAVTADVVVVVAGPVAVSAGGSRLGLERRAHAVGRDLADLAVLL